MTSASHVAKLSALGDARKKSPAPNRRHARRINDACDALQISRSHLYALAAAVKIKLIHIGGRTLVPEAEIDRLAEEGA
jgi:excisionase family DNA binding protein